MRQLAIAVACVAMMAACGAKEQAPAAGAQAEGGAATTAAGAASAAIAPAAAHAQPAAAAQGAAGGQGGPVQTVTGPVLETMDAATYTYVRVKTEKGDLWAASGQFKVAVGDTVTVPLEMPMENFHSNALKRDFPLIFFATSITKAGETPAAGAAGGMGAMGAMGGALPPGHSPTGAARAKVTEKIAQPAGGTAVADLWTKRDTLKGKPVTVRGLVVKFNGGIMGKNWFHLQDGSGKEDEGTNDITVTSADLVVKVGDVVTISGVLVLDKDFGSGYAYPILIENAKLVAGPGAK